MQPNRIHDPGHSELRQHAIPPVKTGQIVCYQTRTYIVSLTRRCDMGCRSGACRIRSAPSWSTQERRLMDRLTNKIALVIGGASGIGLAIANRFSQEGAEVFVTGRREPELLELAQPEDGSVHAIRADAADLHDLERVFATIRSERGRLDILVVNAGLSEHATLDQ